MSHVLRLLKRVSDFTNKHKIVRGMMSYAILWPVGSIIQQTLIEDRNIKTYDFYKCLRFSIYGGLIMGPTMYGWVKFASMLWPNRSFTHSITKAIIEQFTIDPSLICTFLFFMTLFEGNSIANARHEVSAKFFDTYKVGVLYWPICQTFNFLVVPAKNQVICISFFSMLWSAFLAYMKHLEIKQKKDESLVMKDSTYL